MKPVADYIFIEKDNVSNETASGIIVTVDLEREGAAKGTVYATGSEVEGVEVGTRVVFNEHQYDLLFKNKETGKDVLVGKKPGIYATYD